MRPFVRTIVGPPVSISQPAAGRSETGPAEEGLGRLLEQISGGSRDAFAVFFDRTARAVLGCLDDPQMHPAQVAEIFVTTYVEVWWLAGCYQGGDSGVVPWIQQIVTRRTVASNQPAAPVAPADTGQPSPHTIRELAVLLGRPPELLPDAATATRTRERT